MARIAIDVDGVLADLMPTWLASYVRLGGETIRPESIVQYDFKRMAHDPVLFEEALAAVRYDDVAPFDGVAEGIVELRNAGHDLRFVTYVPGWCGSHYADKAAWLDRHVPGFHTRELVYCHSSEKQFIRADYLVEDYEQTLKEWTQRNPGMGVLVNRCYNAQATLIRGTRVSSVLDFAYLMEASDAA